MVSLATPRTTFPQPTNQLTDEPTNQRTRDSKSGERGERVRAIFLTLLC